MGVEQKLELIAETMEKIRDIDKLPTYEEVRLLVLSDQHLWEEFRGVNVFHHVYNVEFVDALAEEIRRLKKSPIIEICAGNGKLSYYLRERGIYIKATDDYSGGLSKDENLVERLSHLEVLRKYKPRVVVGAWLPSGKVAYDVFDFPTVEHIVDIGARDGSTWVCHPNGRNAYGTFEWGEDWVSRTDFIERELKKPTKYSICHIDNPCRSKYGVVNLFSRVNNQ